MTSITSGADLLNDLVKACRDGDAMQVRKLALDPRFKDKIDINGCPNRLAGTPLTAAAVSGHLDIVKIILKNKSVDPNRADGFGKTAYYHAMKMSHKDIEKVLIADKRMKMSTVTSAMCNEILSPGAPPNQPKQPDAAGTEDLIVEIEFEDDVNLSDEEMINISLNIDQYIF